jgi:hypothetical protein
MEDVELADIPLSHLLKPGPHFDNFWLSTFPKKIRGPLLRLPGPHGQRCCWMGYSSERVFELDYDPTFDTRHTPCNFC